MRFALEAPRIHAPGSFRLRHRISGPRPEAAAPRRIRAELPAGLLDQPALRLTSEVLWALFDKAPVMIALWDGHRRHHHLLVYENLPPRQHDRG
ncbi:MAG TPA: hypothetical protein VN999_09440 [Thermoanaerobaculia bacterium]|nr:hypothetical protein [Thermoanaerobaculia bacterium]